MTELKLEKIINECDKHLQRLNSAFSKMSRFMSLNAKNYLKLTDDKVEHIDQFLFRFSKLQDATGEKIVSVDTRISKRGKCKKNKPFIDIFESA